MYNVFLENLPQIWIGRRSHGGDGRAAGIYRTGAPLQLKKKNRKSSLSHYAQIDEWINWKPQSKTTTRRSLSRFHLTASDLIRFTLFWLSLGNPVQFVSWRALLFFSDNFERERVMRCRWQDLNHPILGLSPTSTWTASMFKVPFLPSFLLSFLLHPHSLSPPSIFLGISSTFSYHIPLCICFPNAVGSSWLPPQTDGI